LEVQGRIGLQALYPGKRNFGVDEYEKILVRALRQSNRSHVRIAKKALGLAEKHTNKLFDDHRHSSTNDGPHRIVTAK